MAILSQHDWPSDQGTLWRMGRMLVEQDLFNWWHLEHAGNPDDWQGFDVFAKCELDVLRSVAKTGRQAPRYLFR